MTAQTRMIARRLARIVSHMGRMIAKRTGRAITTNQQTMRTMLKVRSIMAVSLTQGKGMSGIGLLRKVQKAHSNFQF